MLENNETYTPPINQEVDVAWLPQYVPAEVVNDPFDDVLDVEPVPDLDLDAYEEFAGEVELFDDQAEEETSSRFERAARFMIGLPHRTKESVKDTSLRAYAAVKTDPVGSALKVGSAVLTGGTVVAAGGALGFQQGPGNESVRVEFGTDILIHTQNKFYVALGVAALTALIECGSSTLIALGLRKEGGFVQRVAGRLVKKRDRPETEPKEPKTFIGKAIQPVRNGLARMGVMDKITNTALMLGMGSGIYMAKKHFQAEEPSLKDDLKNATKGTAVISATSGAAGYLIAGGIQDAEKHGFGDQAQFFADNVMDWKFWTGIWAAGAAATLTKKGVVGGYRLAKNMLNRNPKFESADTLAVEGGV